MTCLIATPSMHDGRSRALHGTFNGKYALGHLAKGGLVNL